MDDGFHHLGGMLDRKGNCLRGFLERELVCEERRDRGAVPRDQLSSSGKFVSLAAADAEYVQLAKREGTDP